MQKSYKRRMFVNAVSASVAAVLLLAGSADAHPWGGLVVDGNGAIYFTFICPMVSDGHQACVWRLAPGDTEPRAILTSQSDPSDLILTRTPERTVYAAERVGSHPFRTRLWKISGTDEPVLMLPFAGPEIFSADPYAITPDGQILVRRGEDLVRLDPATSESVAVSSDLDSETAKRIRNMLVNTDGAIYIQYGDDLAVLSPDGSSRMMANGVRRRDPPGLPWRGANILFDMAIDSDGSVFFAYYGNREILRVDPDGSISTILESGASWSPHGVDEFEGVVYVLESKTPAPWWQFWEEDDELRPRVRTVEPDGRVATLFEYRRGS